MRYTGERVVPWERAVGERVMHCHVMRYAWAIPFVFNLHVIDLGCGTGYGSFMLSWAARNVLGIDKDRESITFAQANFKAYNLTYSVRDVMAYIEDADAYVAFEVLEHLSRPELILERFRPLMWSMPVNDASRFHNRPYSVGEIDKLTGGGDWFQSASGAIVERGFEWFEPAFVLGVAR